MLRTECLGIFQNGSLPPLPDGCTMKLFSNIYSGNVVELLEVNLNSIVGPPL